MSRGLGRVQSLFTRFVRLGTPLVELNRQGRARASLATLYSWRYRDLQNLPRVQEHPMFSTANAGFVHDFQFVDVPDWEGVGESEPSPHFYQNLGAPLAILHCNTNWSTRVSADSEDSCNRIVHEHSGPDGISSQIQRLDWVDKCTGPTALVV